MTSSRLFGLSWGMTYFITFLTVMLPYMLCSQCLKPNKHLNRFDPLQPQLSDFLQNDRISKHQEMSANISV